MRCRALKGIGVLNRYGLILSSEMICAFYYSKQLQQSAYFPSPLHTFTYWLAVENDCLLHSALLCATYLVALEQAKSYLYSSRATSRAGETERNN